LSVSVHDCRIYFARTKELFITWGRWPPASIFVLLNVVDARLTTQLLNHGGAEAVWWSSHFNSNAMVKGLLALLVALLLIRFNRAYLLNWLNIGMVFVVLSNALCFAGYLSSWLYWQTQIATYP